MDFSLKVKVSIELSFPPEGNSLDPVKLTIQVYTFGNAFSVTSSSGLLFLQKKTRKMKMMTMTMMMMMMTIMVMVVEVVMI